MTPYSDSTEKIVALMYPDTFEVGCVLQQVMGGDRRVCNLFSSDHWRVGGFEGAIYGEGTLEEWSDLASVWTKTPKDAIDRKIEKANQVRRFFKENMHLIKRNGIKSLPTIPVKEVETLCREG